MRTGDPRGFRFDQALVALVVLCGFVFEAPAVIPVAAALAASTAAFSTAAPGPRFFSAVVAPRLAGPVAEETAPWRSAALLLAALLGFAALALVGGDRSLAWLLSLAAAGLGALAGVGGVCVGCQLHSRHRGEEPPGS